MNNTALRTAAPNRRNRWMRVLLAAVSAMGIGLAGQVFFTKAAWVTVDLRTNVLTNFKVYWAADGEFYDERRVAGIRINPVQTRYHFSIGDLNSIRRLRIDPSDRYRGGAKVRIRAIRIHQAGFAPIHLVSVKDLKKLRPVSGIASYRMRPDGLLVTVQNNDPQLEVHIHPTAAPLPLGAGGMIGAGAFFLILFFFLIERRENHFDFVPVLLSFAAALIALMAVFSQVNAHPDEYVHIAAARHYEDHFLPPEICAPGTEHTYSVYGVSRLTSREIVYPLAGKFSRMLSVLPIEPHVRLRLFNVTLFVLICAFCLRFPDSRILGAIFLVSPQIWYLFSYFNSDAFSAFIILIVGYQILGSNTLFHRFVGNPWKAQTLTWGIGLGFLFSSLLFIKKNFYIFIGFFALYLLWRLYFERKTFGPPRKVFEKLAFLVIVMAVPFTAGLAVDYGIHGPRKTEQLHDCREKLADRPYKPSTPLHKKHPWMMLKKKGVSLLEMFTGYHWGRRSFKSAFGVYGYTTIAGPDIYYAAVRMLALGFLIFMTVAAFSKPRWENGVLFLIVLSSSVILLEAALWRAWTIMLQPQGRYLLPIGIMAGFFLHRFRTRALCAGLKAFILAFFLLSVYSFIFVGLINIPKPGF